MQVLVLLLFVVIVVINLAYGAVGGLLGANRAHIWIVTLFLYATIIAVYASAVGMAFGKAGAVTAFPAVDGGFVALLGLSHAAYLAYKAAPKPS